MQNRLFFEDEYEALNLMVSHSSKSFKELAVYLFPDRKPESAYARLKACMNPDKDEFLRFGQIIAAMKFCKCYEPLYFACDETDHERSKSVIKEDRRAALTEEFNRGLEKLEILKSELQRVSQ